MLDEMPLPGFLKTKLKGEPNGPRCHAARGQPYGVFMKC